MPRYVPGTLDSIAPFLDAAHTDVAERAAAVCRTALGRPDPDDDATARAVAPTLVRGMADAGLFDVVSTQDLRGICLTREALAAASPLADTLFAVQALTALPLATAEWHADRAGWLTRLLDGSAVGAFAMTEPGAGSDVAAIATTAGRDGDDWVLDGEKHLISNAGIADIYVVFAATAAPGSRARLGAFAVPATTPGLSLAGAQVTPKGFPGELPEGDGHGGLA